ncbi:hypothetical protein JCM3774_001389 [Rhodotorula dairenensis]
MAWLWSGASSAVTCFYCNSRLTLVRSAPSGALAAAKGKHRQLDDHVAVGSPDAFWCALCGQITRTDGNGEILSDEAAHHDSTLNQASFALRGTATRRDRLPTSFPSTSTTPFCRQCLSNQALQLHLLASYPLDESEPSWASSSSSGTGRRSSGDPSIHGETVDPYPPLNEYRRSLDLRYPLVCPDCAPAVESTIRARDYRVKAQALGWRLGETQRRRDAEARRTEEARRREGRVWIVQGIGWRIRGVAWASTHIAVIAALSADCLAVPGLGFVASPALLLFLAVLSLFWSFWDPTWHAARLERARGRDFVVRHRPTYLTVQMTAYLARLAVIIASWWHREAPASSAAWWVSFAGLAFSLLALVSACVIPKLQPRPPVRLGSRHGLSTSLTTHASTPPADPLEPLANLSLSHNGSLLVPSPPRTPTTTVTRKEQNSAARDRQAQQSGGSFSLGGMRSGRSSPSPLGGSPNCARPAEASAGPDLLGAEVDHDSDTGMDWCPTPPPAVTSTSTSTAAYASDLHLDKTRSPLASASARFATNHVTFARQRFVPPDTRPPTGLEGMFERVVAVRDGGVSETGVVPEVGRDVEMKGVTPTDSGRRRAWLAGWWK